MKKTTITGKTGLVGIAQLQYTYRQDVGIPVPCQRIGRFIRHSAGANPTEIVMPLKQNLYTAVLVPLVRDANLSPPMARRECAARQGVRIMDANGECITRVFEVSIRFCCQSTPLSGLHCAPTPTSGTITEK